MRLRATAAAAALVAASLAALVAAYPANPGPYDLPLPDGTSLRVWATGDEFSGPRYVDAEGRNVHVHEDGTPAYYDPTGEPGAPLQSRRHAAEQSKWSPRSMPDEWDAGPRRLRTRFNEALAASAAKRAKAHATEPLVFVLVQYPDFASRPGLNEHIQKMAFNASYVSNEGDTINSYYAAQSKNKFQFTRAKETSGTADDGVIGPVTVNCSWVNQSGWGASPDYSCLQRKGLLAAAPFLDLKSLDLNGDNFISGDELHVVLVIAGGDAGSLNAVGFSRCPHVWGFMQPGAWLKVQAQGVTFGEHVFIGENVDDCTVPFRIGVLAHELAHTLTVPDLYDLDKGKSIMRPWCLMDGGNWNNKGNNPGMLCAFARMYLGWVTPTEVSRTSTAAIALKPASVDSEAVLQFGPNSNGIDWEWGSHSGTGEYFLVENRQKVGCDKYATGSGVLVWHINEASAPDSNKLSSLSLIVRLQRKNERVKTTDNPADDVLTSSARASIYCGASGSNQVPNTLFDNDSSSCVSLSASVNATSGVALVEPWTDAGCGSCVYSSGALPAPTQKYSIFELFRFSLAPTDGSRLLQFTDDTPVAVALPWNFMFGGRNYSNAYVSPRGFVNFVSANMGVYGIGRYPTLAPFATDSELALSVRTRSGACVAPFAAGPCWVVQWQTKTDFVAQAVLSQRSGDVYYVFSGNKSNVDAKTYVSTGISGAATYPGGLWTDWDWTDPLGTVVALLVTPTPLGAIALPFEDTFDSSPSSAVPSSSIWSRVTCGEVASACGASSGRALTFTPTIYLNRNALTHAIDVSACANVSVSFVVGPAAAAANCSPVSTGVYFGPMLGSVSYPQAWTWFGAGQAQTFLAVPRKTNAVYLSWNWMNGPGRFFLDDLRVSCAVPKPAPASSSSAGSHASHASSAKSSGSHKPGAQSSSSLSAAAATPAGVAAVAVALLAVSLGL
eukprot:m51a1_g943 hypothetical protein (951) ;mRNA; f:259583-262781